MHSFHYRDGDLFCENVSLTAAAEEFGTPLYVYSAGTILDHYRRLDTALAEIARRLRLPLSSTHKLFDLTIHEVPIGP
jgi:diaminopimelate decarboxylase